MEVKQEINQIIDNLPSEVLTDLLQYLQQLEKVSSRKMRLSIHLQTILEEDEEVLTKLAQ